MNENNVPTFAEHVNEGMTKFPETDGEILRHGIQAELDAINLYIQMAGNAKSSKVKETLLEIAKEEKVHIGEFEALLKEIDKEYVSALKDGEEETK